MVFSAAAKALKLALHLSAMLATAMPSKQLKGLPKRYAVKATHSKST